MMIKKYVLFFTLFWLCALCPGVSAQTAKFSTDADKYRIVYAEKYSSSPFLVVERVDKTKVACRRYKSDKKALIKFSPNELRKLYFFEDRPFSEFDLFNGAFLCYKQRPYLLLFAKTYYPDNPRLKMLMQFEEAQKEFRKTLKQVRDANKKISDADDRIDTLYEVLNSCDLPKYIFNAIDAGDWILAFYIYEQYLNELKELGSGYSEDNYFYKDIMLTVKQTEKKILKKYNSYIQEDFPELDTYQQATDSEWEKTSAESFQALYLTTQSWQHSFEIVMNGELSSASNFQLWSKNMLLLLSLSRNMTIPGDWRKKFNDELNYHIKMQKK